MQATTTNDSDSVNNGKLHGNAINYLERAMMSVCAPLLPLARNGEGAKAVPGGDNKQGLNLWVV